MIQEPDQLVAEPGLTPDAAVTEQAFEGLAGQPSDVVREHGVAVAHVERLDVRMASLPFELPDPPLDTPVNDLLVQARSQRPSIVPVRHYNHPKPMDSRVQAPQASVTEEAVPLTLPARARPSYTLSGQE